MRGFAFASEAAALDTNISPFLRGFDRLFDLSDAERDRLNQLTQDRQDLPARRKLISEGRRHEEAFVVLSGWLAELKLLRDGGRQILNFRMPGEVAGIDSLAYSLAPHSTVTLTECTVVPLRLEPFEEVQKCFPRLAAGLLLMTLREEAILHHWEVRLGRRTAYQRLAHLLAELHARVRLRGLDMGPSFLFPPTQQDLADATGLTVPYVNRILQTMREEGLLRLSGRQLEILDPARLAESGGFDSAYLVNWGKGTGSDPDSGSDGPAAGRNDAIE